MLYVIDYFIGDVTFEEIPLHKAELWLVYNPYLQQYIQEYFSPLIDQLDSNQLETWRQTPLGMVVYLIIKAFFIVFIIIIPYKCINMKSILYKLLNHYKIILKSMI